MSATGAAARIRPLLEQLVERKVLLGAQVFHRHRGETCRFVVGRETAGTGAEEAAGRLYCANKPVLAVAAGRAVQDGLVGFQDPLTRFFADCAPAMAAVSVADLLGHTVRLPPSLHRDSSSLAERGRRIAESGAPRPGPAHYNAQSTSALLGAILEQVHAMPLAEIVEERVARPLGLRDLALVPRPGRPYGALHRRDGSMRFVPVEDEARGLAELNPGQAGVSTAADMGRLYSDVLESLAGRGTLLSQATARRLVAVGPPVRLYDLGERSWGLGFQRDLPRGILGAGWGPGTFGHLGTAPRRVVVLHAADPDAGRVLALRLFSAVEDRWVRQLTAVA